MILSIIRRGNVEEMKEGKGARERGKEETQTMDEALTEVRIKL